MIDFFAKLKDEVEQGDKEGQEISNKVNRYSHLIDLQRKAIEKLRDFLKNYEFTNKQEEIEFFKMQAPMFYSNYLYLIRVLNIEVLKLTMSSKKLRRKYEHDINEIELYFSHNFDYCKYYTLGHSYLDDQLFTRQHGTNWMVDDLAPVIDPNFTIASHKASCIIAFQKYRIFLENEIHILEGHLTDPDFPKTEKKITCERSKSFIVEFIVATYLSEMIYVDGRPASLSWLKERTEQIFAVDLKDFKSLDYANRSRKKEMTPLLNLMTKKYMERADRLND